MSEVTPSAAGRFAASLPGGVDRSLVRTGRRISSDSQPLPRLQAVADERRAVVPALQRAGENLARDAIVLRDEHVHIGGKLLHNWAPHMTRSTVKRLGITILCGLAGLILDIWRQGSMAPLLLGRIVTLPVAILFGPWYGALAALIHATAGRGVFAVGVRILPIEAIVIGFVLPLLAILVFGRRVR
jgi:hypothetical protein